MSKVTYSNTPDRVEQAEIGASHDVRLVGEVFVIAYADANTAKQIASGSADVTVLAHSEPSPAAGVIVKIP